MAVFVNGLVNGLLAAVLRVRVLGVRVGMGVNASVGVAMFMLVLDVLVAMGVARAAVVVWMRVFLALDQLLGHFVFIVYK
jgi:hypothetical protein